MHINTALFVVALTSVVHAFDPVEESFWFEGVNDWGRILLGNSSGNGSFHPKNSTCESCEVVSIVLLIDTSQSIKRSTFEKVKSWLVEEFVPGWNIGPDNVRFGIVTFHEKIETVYYLNDLKTTDDVIKAIKGLQFNSGATNIEKGLEAARDVLAKGRRDKPGAPSVLILISDGTDDCHSASVFVAEDIRYKFNTRILAVGIPGDTGVDSINLEEITGEEKFVFTLADVNDLKNATYAVVDNMACCACYLDIIVIIETSELIHNISQSVAAVKRLAAMLDIAPGLSHMAIIHFSSPDKRTGVLLTLEEGTSYSKIEAALDKLVENQCEYFGLSDVNLALELALEIVQGNSNKTGDRAEAGNAVIFIGQGYYDNADNCCPSPFKTAKKLQKYAEVYALGLGPRENLENLELIAGNGDRVRSLANYTEIAQQIADSYMLQAGCKPHPIPPCEKLDLVFIFDSSGSINWKCKSCYDKIKTFASGIANSMQIGSDHVQVGLMTFSNEVDFKSAAHPGVYNTNKDLIKAIKKMPYLNKGTNTGQALLLVGKWLQQGPEAGFREGVNKAIILFSDGLHTRGKDPVEVAFNLRFEYGIRILTVGVPEGNGHLDRKGFKELVGIAGDVSYEFNVTDLAQIDNIVNDLQVLLPCDGDNRTTTTGPPPTKHTAVTHTIDPDWTTTTREMRFFKGEVSGEEDAEWWGSELKKRLQSLF